LKPNLEPNIYTIIAAQWPLVLTENGASNQRANYSANPDDAAAQRQ